MKVLLASITDSGILRVRSELIRELIGRGDTVTAAVPLERDWKKLEELGCRCIDIKIRQHGTDPFSDLKVYRQYRKILRAEKPDCVLLFTTKPNIYAGMACRRAGIPAIVNITGMGRALGGGGRLQKLMIPMYRLALGGKNIRKIFFQNDDSLTFFREHRIGRPETYARIPGSGVNLERFPLQPFPDGATTDFLFVARVMKEKGIDQYLEAAETVRKTHPEAVFHVLGSCEESYREILEKKTSEGVIVYHGRVDNMADYERLSQCTIQPSYYPEGMSNVILEAASSGRPVITTDHPGCREGVDDGLTGFIVPVKDAAALAEAAERFLRLSREERISMGLAGRKKMEREFDRKIVTGAYLKEMHA